MMLPGFFAYLTKYLKQQLYFRLFTDIRKYLLLKKTKIKLSTVSLYFSYRTLSTSFRGNSSQALKLPAKTHRRFLPKFVLLPGKTIAGRSRTGIRF
jgi:hypothetical protein